MPVNKDIIIRVVDKFLMQLEDQLHEKKVDVTFSDALKVYLGKKGFDPLMAVLEWYEMEVGRDNFDFEGSQDQQNFAAWRGEELPSANQGAK